MLMRRLGFLMMFLGVPHRRVIFEKVIEHLQSFS